MLLLDEITTDLDLLGRHDALAFLRSPPEDRRRRRRRRRRCHHLHLISHLLGRQELMAFLKEESESRGVAVVYCTHIFDGLDGWATHVAHLAPGGRLQFCAAVTDIAAELEPPPELRARGWGSPSARSEVAPGAAGPTTPRCSRSHRAPP